jgi:Tfp pilus assembly protein PilF
MDGVDMIWLGPANRSSLPPKSNKVTNHKSKNGLSFDPLRTTFVESNLVQTPAELVSNMIWASGGKESTELILEGFFPGVNDRWTVRIGNHSCPVEPISRTASHGTENPENEQNTRSLRARTLTEASDDSTAALTEDGSTNLPTHMLWDHIWGSDEPPPVPSHMQYNADGSDEDEDILQLAAACSVPVDLDEDTFIISSPDHFRSILDIAMVPLQGQRFESALKILEKLLYGLEEQNDEKFEHLHGCTNHNMGIILMCQADFNQALERFERAVATRTKCLPQNHPDVAVSVMRHGQAHFALGNLKEALESFELALSMSTTEDSTRAKMLNNFGAVYYQQEDFAEALKAFTSALEIQRQWLDGNLRRESIIYDASVTLCNMGKVFLELKDYEVASSVFEEACLVSTVGFMS